MASRNCTNMISNHEISEFEEKFKELTKIGNPSLKGNPLAVFSLNFSQKPFYGYVNQSGFRITKNANIIVIPYLIAGEFKKKGNRTEVKYEIIPMKFGYYWIRIFPVIFNILGLIALVINYKSIEFETLNFAKVLFVLLLIEVFFLLPLIITEILKARFEKKFLKELKIQNSDK